MVIPNKTVASDTITNLSRFSGRRFEQVIGLGVKDFSLPGNEIDPKDNDGALTYRDPTGRPLAPILPPAPIDGPDVKFRLALEASAKSAPAGDRKSTRLNSSHT